MRAATTSLAPDPTTSATTATPTLTSAAAGGGGTAGVSRAGVDAIRSSAASRVAASAAAPVHTPLLLTELSFLAECRGKL